MSLDRRSFLLLASSATVLGACKAGSGLDIANLDLTSGATEETNAETFMRHLTDGSKGFMHALAEMNSLIGRGSKATALKEYLKSTPKTWDAETFKKASAMADKAALPADAKITASKATGTSHVIGAWAFGTYGGYMNKETVGDARRIVLKKSKDAKTQDAIKAAKEALGILPSQIETSAVIVDKSASFMSKHGIAQPDAIEAQRIILDAMADADTTDLKKIFT